MTYESFLVLHEKLKAGITHAATEALAAHDSLLLKQPSNNNTTRTRGRGNFTSKKINKYKAPPVPNGPISTSVRLACALRYFAGGSPYDLMAKYGISHTQVLNCVWSVVQAINLLKEFHISYPSDEEEQHRIAAAFRGASAVDFDNCARAIDGILIWISKPSKKDAERSGIGMKKLAVLWAEA